MATLTLRLPAWQGEQQDKELASIPAPIVRRVERAGAVAESLFVARFVADEPSSPSSPTGNKAEKRGGSSPTPESRDSRTQGCFKLEQKDLDEDWYELLKLKQAEGATQDEIRSAYRRRCLETHPDKQPDHSDREFKLVQRAFEILGNPEARRAYDSSRPFDDAIPADEPISSDAKFYDIFAPVFARNMKWAVAPMDVTIGDDSTPLAEVRRFYDAWYRFRSWRDFSHMADLQAIDEGMMREEKRFYMRENERALEGYKRAEAKRVRTLVERAYKLDPRLRREREAEEAERERVRQERENERKAYKEEEERRRVEAVAKAKADEEARKQAIVQAKMAVKEGQAKVSAFLEAAGLLDPTPSNKILEDKVRGANVQWLFSKLNPTDAPEIAERLCNEPTVAVDGVIPVVKLFNELLQERERIVGVNRWGEPVKAAPAVKHVDPVKTAAPVAATSASKVEWSDLDLLNLQKAIAKFPPGTVDRWRRIATTLQNKFTEEQVLTKTKEMEKIWQNDKSVMKQAPPKLGGADPAGEAEPAWDRMGAPAPAVAPVAPAPVPTTAESTDVLDWTVSQQKQLEGALRELKDYKEKDKFNKVAKSVDGKTAKQCFERFKYLCSLSKKATPGSK